MKHNDCVKSITAETVDISHRLEPCEGIFADVKSLPPKNITRKIQSCYLKNTSITRDSLKHLRVHDFYSSYIKFKTAVLDPPVVTMANPFMFVT